jgi:hypothetical protein
MTSSGPVEHCQPICQELGILTVHSYYVLTILTLLKTTLVPFSIRSSQHDYGSRRAGDLDLPRWLVLTKSSYPYITMKLYNTLPLGVRAIKQKHFEAR